MKITLLTVPNTYVWGSGYDNNPTLINRAVVSIWSSDSSSNRFDYSYAPYSYVTGVPISGNWNAGNFLTPEEAWNIDTKMDDGQPGRGAILGTVSMNCTGIATGTDYNAEYVLTNSAKDCRIDYRPLF